MNCILHLDSSPRGERSLSRALTNEFNRTWQQTRIKRDVLRVGGIFYK